MKNDYYAIACEDVKYLQLTLSSPYYNQISVQAQQVAEKMLKSVAERTCTDIEKLMISHNLRGLYDEISRNEPQFKLDRGKLSMLKDFYFDAKYPGNNFVTVSKQECQECLDTMYDVIYQTNLFRKRHNLETLDIPKTGLQSASEIHVF